MTRLPDVSPDQYRTFFALPVFERRWAEMGLTDADLLALQAELMTDPAAGTVVPGAGGLRKVRFAPPSRGGGKSGGARVYYLDLSRFGVIVLAVAFLKGEAQDIGADQKRALATVVGVIEAELTRRRARAERRKRTGG